MTNLELRSILLLRRPFINGKTTNLRNRNFTTLATKELLHRDVDDNEHQRRRYTSSFENCRLYNLDQRLSSIISRQQYSSVASPSINQHYRTQHSTNMYNLNQNKIAMFSAVGSPSSGDDETRLNDKSSEGQKHLSRKEKLANVAKRGGKLAKKGAFSMKDLIHKYGWTFIGTYISIYFVTLGSLFVAVDSGALDPMHLLDLKLPFSTMDVAGGDASQSSTTDIPLDTTGTANDDHDAKSAVKVIVQKLGEYKFTKPYAPIVDKNPHFANLAIAWVATKVTEPIRLGVTVAILPYVSRKKKTASNTDDA